MGQCAGHRRPVDACGPACRPRARSSIPRLGGPARVGVGVEGPVRQVDALTVSVSAFALSMFGASHCLPYQVRIRSRACDSAIFSGRSDSGRKASLTSSYGTSAAEPQKSQRRPTLSASKTEIAWQLWQRTDVFCGVPAARRIRECRAAPREIVLDDDRVGAADFERRRRLGAAIRTNQRLLGGIPVRFGAARRAVKLLRAVATVSSPATLRLTRSSPRSRRATCRNSAIAALVIRHCVPISCPSDRRPRGSR